MVYEYQPQRKSEAENTRKSHYSNYASKCDRYSSDSTYINRSKLELASLENNKAHRRPLLPVPETSNNKRIKTYHEEDKSALCNKVIVRPNNVVALENQKSQTQTAISYFREPKPVSKEVSKESKDNENDRCTKISSIVDSMIKNVGNRETGEGIEFRNEFMIMFASKFTEEFTKKFFTHMVEFYAKFYGIKNQIESNK